MAVPAMILHWQDSRLRTPDPVELVLLQFRYPELRLPGSGTPTSVIMESIGRLGRIKGLHNFCMQPTDLLRL